MTAQAPAILDVRLTGAGQSGRAVSWLSGIGVRQVRLACGLVMFTYVFSHFFNHAPGNISYATMEAWLDFHVWFWRIRIVNYTLYTAAFTHFMLGLWALYQRRHFRYTAIEITQIVFGLSIPLLLASHFSLARLGGALFDRAPPHYAGVLVAYWSLRPYMIAVQFTLMTVVWIHACIGLYFWLRLKPFFRWARPFLLAIAVLLPPLAIAGTNRVGMRQSSWPRSRNGGPLTSIRHRRSSAPRSMSSRCIISRSFTVSPSCWFSPRAAFAPWSSASADRSSSPIRTARCACRRG